MDFGEWKPRGNLPAATRALIISENKKTLL